MLTDGQKIAMDKINAVLLVIAAVIAMILSFLTGYLVFRYEELDKSKAEMEIGNFGEIPSYLLIKSLYRQVGNVKVYLRLRHKLG